MAGRKRKLNPRLAERILELIADSLTIRQVFEKEEIDYTWASFRKELVSSNDTLDFSINLDRTYLFDEDSGAAI